MSSSPLNTSTGGGSRRRTSGRAAEAEAFNKVTKESEERLAKRQVARDEARRLRIAEIERQQRKAEQEEAKGITTGHSSLVHSHSAMKDITVVNDAEKDDLKEKVASYEERIRRDMIIFSQLDNEKSALHYEVDLVKDDMEEMRELGAQNRRENRDLTSEVKLLHRTMAGLDAEKKSLKHLLQMRDNLIHEHKLVLVEREVGEDELASSSTPAIVNGHADGDDAEAASTSGCRLLHNLLAGTAGSPSTEQLLFTQSTVAMVDRAVPGNQSLDDKVRKVVNMNKAIRTQLEEAEQALHTRRTSRIEADRHVTHQASTYDEQQKDALKHAADLKFKLQESEREKNNAEGLNVRLDAQLKRTKTQLEEGEAETAELKASNRNMKKELRDSECALDEQREMNKHLEKRLEKLRLSRQGGK